MTSFLLLAFAFLGVVQCIDNVPKATGLKEIRRAPLPSMSNFAPLAKSLRPISTGVRRAPVSSQIPRSNHQQIIPKPAGHIQRAPIQPVQFIPIPVPVFPRFEDLPTLPPHELHTLAPHTFPTITPIPGLPTLPPLTMPPSFQRLLGITSTTTTMKPEEEIEPDTINDRKRQEIDQENDIDERESQINSKDLNTVRSRLSKFIRGKENSSDEQKTRGEESADWIVPFH
ncbi:unnamed protein product [Caenorhabditis angaria]|uniref:Uncharacterized protein n=1 Tax=Caenorhabditis angaria TaxID=860376 RepID=A0A9P1N006_9PELO|nr:unnamed protein product [Caenorhabditis angaria]